MATETRYLPEPQGPTQLVEMLRTPAKIKAVLFDMDGLLVDTETLGIRVAVAVCRDLDIDLNLEEQRSFIGVTDKKFYQDLFNKRNVNHNVLTILGRHFEIYEELLKTDLTSFEGANTLPKNLKAKGYRLGLVSGSTTNQIGTILDSLQIREAFDVIVSCDDITKSKPDPEGYMIAAKKLGVEPKDCLVFEDARTGVLAGKNAGMKVAGVVNGGGQDLSSADFIINNLATVETNP